MGNGEETGLLSIIVPVYNLAPYLDQCVRSLLDQRYENLEVLLIDDGSTDGGGALCDEFAQRDSRVRVLHKENGGLSAARNAGLDMAGGSWIGFVDGDDWVAPEMYANLIQLCVDREADAAACGFLYVFDHKSLPDCKNTGACRVYDRKEALTLLPAQTDVRFEVCPKVFRRETIGDARFLPGQIFEDIRFTRLTFARINRFAYLDAALYSYRQKRPGNTNSRFPAAKLHTLPECDAFAAALRGEGLAQAGDGMEAFTLDFLIRLYVNAKSCKAEPEILRQIQEGYRKRFAAARENPQVRKLRGGLFALSPALYDWLSMRLHNRE